MTTQYAKDQPQGYNNHIRNIAFVGAGGRVGRYIIEEILKTGNHKVTAITREDTTKGKIPDGVTVKKVNYEDPSTLVSALQGQDMLIVTMSVFAPPDTSAKLIDAAAKAGVPWILPNEWGSDHLDAAYAKESMVGEPLLKNRRLIEEKGVSSWIAIVCSFWYEYSLAGGPEFYGFDFAKKHVTWYDEGKIAINTTTWAQVGRGVAALVSLKILPGDANDKSLTLSQFRNDFCRIYSFKASQRDMFASVLKVTGDKESDWTTSEQPTKERYDEGIKRMQTGDRMGFAQALYSRSFYPSVAHDQKSTFDLPKESFDEATKFALDIVSRGGSWAID